jgi:hypothetical protein
MCFSERYKSWQYICFLHILVYINQLNTIAFVNIFYGFQISTFHCIKSDCIPIHKSSQLWMIYSSSVSTSRLCFLTIFTFVSYCLVVIVSFAFAIISFLFEISHNSAQCQRNEITAAKDSHALDTHKSFLMVSKIDACVHKFAWFLDFVSSPSINRVVSKSHYDNISCS